MAEELAVAYLSLVPSLKGAKAAITSELTGAEVTSATASAGASLGGVLGSNIGSGVAPAAASLRTAMAGAVAVFAGNEVLSTLKGWADGYANAGREALKFQRVTGATAEDASRLSIVAQQTGLQADQLAMAFVRMSRAAQGPSGQGALSQLGVSLNDAQGKARPLTGVLSDLADKFASMPNGVQKNALALQLFGRSGAELLPLLNRGASGIDAIIAKADQLGLTLGQDDLDKVKGYIAAQRDLQLSVKSFQQTVGASVFPALTEGLQTATDVARSAASAFQALPEPVRNSAVAIAALSAGAAVIFGGGGLLIHGAMAAQAAWSSLGASITGSSAAAAASQAEVASTASVAAVAEAELATASTAAAAAEGELAVAGTAAAVAQAELAAASQGAAAAQVETAGIGAAAAASTGKVGGLGSALGAIGKPAGMVVAGVVLYQLGQQLNEATKDADAFAAALGRIKSDSGDPLANLADAAEASRGVVDQARDSLNGLVTGLTDVVTLGWGFDLDTPTVQLGHYRRAIDDVSTAIHQLGDRDSATAIKEIDAFLAGAKNPQGFRGGDRFKSLKEDLAKYRQQLVDAQKGNDATAASTDALGDAEAAAASKTAVLDRAMSGLNARLRMSSFSFDGATTRAEAFGQALDQSSTLDDMISTSVSFGQSLQDFRKGLTATDESTGRQAASTNTAADAQTRLRDAVERTTPALSAMRINLDANAAAGDAFAKSLGQGFERDTITSALDLGDAFGKFRATLSYLPQNIDVSGAALNRYGSRADESIKAVMSLGAATRDYLTSLVKQGESSAYVRSEADRLRSAYSEQLSALGLTADQMGRYQRLLSVTPEQVNTAITLSEIEKSRYKLTTYLSLLDGKIPAEISSKVVAQVDRGDIEGASKTLAAFASTNPVKLQTDVTPPSETSMKQVRDAVQFALPATIDVGKMLTGQYSPEQLAGIGKAEELSKSAGASLQALVKGGASIGDVLARAATLRQSLSDVFAQAGASQQAIDELFSSAGLQDRQIEYAVKVSGTAEAVAQMQLLNGLISDQDKPTPTVQREIALRVSTGDLQGASDLLSAWVQDSQDGLLSNPLLVALAAPDVTAADSTLDEFRTTQGEQVIRLHPDVDMTPASDTMQTWFAGFLRPEQRIKVDADTTDADKSVAASRQKTEQAPPAKQKITADSALWDGAMALLRQGAQQPVKVPIVPDTGLLDTWFPGWGQLVAASKPFTPFVPKRAAGGIIDGPSYPRDTIPALVTGGEFVVRDSIVARPGVRDFLDRLNKGQVPGFAAGGFVPRSHAVASAGRAPMPDAQLAAASGGVSIDSVTVVSPEPERVPYEFVRRTKAELARAF